MAPVQFSMSAQGAREYRELAAKLQKAARKDLRAKLRKKIAEAGKPVVDEVRDAVTHLPVTGSRGGGTKQRRGHNVARARATERAKNSARRRQAGLRRTIANATGLRVTARGIRIVVDSSRLPESQQTLPRHLDSPKGWRHPTFGEHGWVHQQGKPYFAVTIKKRAPHFRRAALAAIDEIKAELEK